MIRYILLLLFVVTSSTLAQPEQFMKESMLNDPGPNKYASIYKNAGVKSVSIYQQQGKSEKSRYKSGYKLFDNNGRITTDVTLERNGYREQEIIYAYGPNGKMTDQKEEYYNNDTLISVSTSHTIFDASGRKSETHYTNSALITYYSKFKYDDAENSVTEYNYGSDGTIARITTSSYNSKNYLSNVEESHDNINELTKMVYYEDSVQAQHFKGDSLIRIECYSFDEQNNVTGVRVTLPGLNKSFTDYKAEYENGKKILEKRGHIKKNIWYEQIQFDSNGDPVKDDNYGTDGRLQGTTITKYNSKRLIELKQNGAEDNPNADRTIYKYEYY
jgi:hypothetical protein